ncbi:hypothetical protein [Chitinimonas taiwanensis]|uniref:hypothetical protein n=1 Tax=Chitinimonas taiwanensis TaxID=240412 RepID=UPI0035B0996C
MMRTLSTSLLLLSALLSSALEAAPVELVSEHSLSMTRYSTTFYSESYTVAVDNLGPNKEVTIRRQQQNGSWVDIPLYYQRAAGGNKEIWIGGLSAHASPQPGEKFAVRYKVNGVEYWDNNNNQDYRILDQGPLLGRGKQISGSLSVTAGLNNNKIANGLIHVRNLALNKEVKLVYTTNNWASATVVNASYGGTPFSIGYGSHSNPNLNGAETWRVAFEFPANVQGQYYLEYKVNGQSYYDNNFGANYPLY